MYKNKKVLIAVIAYNEASNIKNTIEDLQNNNFGFDIVVVDNASIDNTVDIVESLGIDVLKHCINTGGGMGTVVTYLNYAYKNNYDCVCQFDGDGQHIAEELPKIVDLVIDKNVDYAIGSRFIEGEGFQSTALRRIGIKLFSTILSNITQNKLTDTTSGFKAYSRKIMNTFSIKDRIELNDINQFLLISFYDGAKISEVPVVMKEREFGESEFNFINSIKFPLNGIINIFGTWMQKRKYMQGTNNDD